MNSLPLFSYLHVIRINIEDYGGGRSCVFCTLRRRSLCVRVRVGVHVYECLYAKAAKKL